MENLFSIIGIALVALVFILLLNSSKMPVISLLIMIASGIIIFLMILPKIQELFLLFKNVGIKAGVGDLYLGLILKIVAISYIGEFATEICRDAGVSSLATKIELAAKVVILILAAPLVLSILEKIIGLLP